MKYGQTLRQRSAPEWVYHNISYDNIKHMIKEHTTPGTGKAVSVPGQGNEVETAFEDQLFNIFRDQDEHITLFVKSKSSEISHKLDSLETQLKRLQSYGNDGVPVSRRRLHIAAKIERDAIAVGEEIQNLSRFIGANRLAFHKLLKKYRKWSHSDALGDRVKSKILGKPTSFSQLDGSQFLARWIDILQQIRASRSGQVQPGNLKTVNAYSPSAISTNLEPEQRPSSAAIAEQLQNAAKTKSDLEYDVALANTPLGDAGRKAVYWVHPEQLIELQVLLLQYLRPLRSIASDRRESGTPSPATTRRNSGSGTPVAGQSETGCLILDDADDYGRRQSRATVGAAEGQVGHASHQAALSARWTSEDGFLMSLKDVSKRGAQPTRSAWIKKKCLGRYFDLNQPNEPWRKPKYQRQPSSEANKLERTNSEQDLNEIRAWLRDHQEIQPLVTITSKRSRFADITESAGMGQWCTIDTDILLKLASLSDAKSNKEWPINSPGPTTRFPYAVVEIRQEGKIVHDLVDILDRSHLTERVRGFSLAAHAVWTVRRPVSMSPPFWLPALDRDIRKVPEAPPKRISRHNSSVSTPHSRRGSNNPYDSKATSTTLEGTSSSAPADTSSLDQLPKAQIETAEASASTTTKPKRKRRIPRQTLQTTKKGPGYWNEYDHPEDGSGDENAYYIYVDPNAPSDYPGKAVITFFGKTFRFIFSGRKGSDPTHVNLVADEERALLTDPNRTLPGSEDSDTSSVDALPSLSKRSRKKRGTNKNAPSNNSYGAILPPPALSPESTIQPAKGSLTGFRLPDVCLAAGLVILVILFFLGMVGRRKLRGEVDAGIVFGISMVFVFLAVGAIALFREVSFRRDRMGRTIGMRGLSWWRWTVAGVVFAGECASCGLLLAWVVKGA